MGMPRQKRWRLPSNWGLENMLRGLMHWKKSGLVLRKNWKNSQFLTSNSIEDYNYIMDVELPHKKIEDLI